MLGHYTHWFLEGKREILGLYGDNGKESRNYYIRAGYILGL